MSRTEDPGQATIELLVYERSPAYAALFAKLSGLPLSEVRSLTQLRQALAVSEPRILCLQVLPAELLPVMDVIWRAKAAGATVIAMPERSLATQQLPLWEAGTDFLFWSMLDQARAERLLQRSSASDGPRRQRSLSWREEVWQRLPWKRSASRGSGMGKN